jgi:uncharacterized membrane protein YedE/YeeE
MEQSYIYALIGGIIIAIAASLKMLFNGRIAGISGILGGIFNFTPGDISWRALFIIGMIGSGFMMKYITPQFFQYEIDTSYPILIIAGLFVGFGTRLGSGCTSGHGVCGIPRLSTRSILATAIFMTTAAITVLILK